MRLAPLEHMRCRLQQHARMPRRRRRAPRSSVRRRSGVGHMAWRLRLHRHRRRRTTGARVRPMRTCLRSRNPLYQPYHTPPHRRCPAAATRRTCCRCQNASVRRTVGRHVIRRARHHQVGQRAQPQKEAWRVWCIRRRWSVAAAATSSRAACSAAPERPRRQTRWAPSGRRRRRTRCLRQHRRRETLGKRCVATRAKRAIVLTRWAPLADAHTRASPSV